MGDELLELKANVLKALGQPTRLKILDGVSALLKIQMDERKSLALHLA